MRPDLAASIQKDGKKAETAAAEATISAGSEEPQRSAPSAVVFRLRAGQDLGVELIAYVMKHQIRACTVVSCVGNIRFTHTQIAF
jgi:hypothetical protein